MSLRWAAACVAAAAAVAVVPASQGSAAITGDCSYPVNLPVLAMSASPATVTAGAQVHLAGKFSRNGCGLGHAAIVLEQRAIVSGNPSGSWHTFATVTTASNGTFFATRTPTRSEQLRSVFTGADGVQPATSSTLTELVRTRIGMTVKVLSACRVRLSGGTTPVKARRTVKIQRRGPISRFRGWTTVWSVKTGAKGGYSTTKTLPCHATYNLAVYIGGDSTNLSNRSRTVFGITTHR